jgi:hypothetical protein
MSRKFSQTWTLRSDEPDTLITLIREWDEFQASQEIMGYTGTRTPPTAKTPVDIS